MGLWSVLAACPAVSVLAAFKSRPVATDLHLPASKFTTRSAPQTAAPNDAGQRVTQVDDGAGVRVGA